MTFGIADDNLYHTRKGSLTISARMQVKQNLTREFKQHYKYLNARITAEIDNS